MMRFAKIGTTLMTWVAAALALGGAAASQETKAKPAEAGTLDADREYLAKNFDAFLKTVKIKVGDASDANECSWSGLKWHVDIRKAREKAAKEGKPIAMWTSSGFPCGSN